MTAVFFDMDGTLIDSRADLAATVNHTRRDLGLAELPQDEILSHVGHGAKYLLAHAIPEVSGGGRAEERTSGSSSLPLREGGRAEARPSRDGGLSTLFMSHYGEHMLEAVTLYPGVEEGLRELHRRGILLGINTAKPRFATMAILDHFGLTGLFGGAIVAGGDCAEMKPSPLPLRQCAGLMRHPLSAGDWMVGDNWTDIKCATNAGVKSAFCDYGFGVLSDSVPTVKIGGFSELLEMVI